MNKAQMETLIRNDFLALIAKAIEAEKETDALPVSANEIAVPCLDPEGNETWAVIKVSIPRGTRNGNGYDPYDGYAAADDYKMDLEEKAQKKAKAEEKKQAKIAKDQKAREEKKALAEANKNLKELKHLVKNVEQNLNKDGITPQG